jgi:glycosyltransferase involved in cell wall biosynthesis
MQIVTIWNTYGPYHLARVSALEKVFSSDKISCLAHCSSSDEYSFFNIKTKNIKILVNKKSSELGFFNSFFATYKSLQLIKPQLILSCGYERPETFASLIWSRMNNSVIFLMLDNNFDDKPRLFRIEIIKSIYLRFFEGFIYGGKLGNNYLTKLGVPSSKIVTGYNCVDNEYISLISYNAKKYLPPYIKQKYFLCVSRLIPKKNLMKLVKAYNIYAKKTYKPWSLVICGEGPERKALESYIKQQNLSKLVILVGAIDEFSELINYYSHAKYLILASHENEQWGLVVNEAMACGLPVLVSKYCGCASSLVINNKNGFIFDSNIIHEIVQKLIWMHKNSRALAEMGSKSKKIIQDYSTMSLALKVKHLFSLKAK